VYTTLTPPSVTGTQIITQFTLVPNGLGNAAICDPRVYPIPIPTSALPYQNFPQFDGSNPRFWDKRCETYFDVYVVDPRVWVRMATMNLSGSAALWFQTLQTPVEKFTWEAFVQAACTHFDKDEHNLLLRQFFPACQTASVAEYVDQFSDIVHQLLAHDPNITASFITNQFVDGLRKDIRVVRMVHRP